LCLPIERVVLGGERAPCSILTRQDVRVQIIAHRLGRTVRECRGEKSIEAVVRVGRDVRRAVSVVDAEFLAIRTVGVGRVAFLQEAGIRTIVVVSAPST